MLFLILSLKKTLQHFLNALVFDQRFYTLQIAVLKNDLSPKMHSLHFYVKFINADSVKAALDM